VPETPTICANCKHIHPSYAWVIDSSQWPCSANPIGTDYVTGEKLYALCRQANTEGKCGKFESAWQEPAVIP
jgi:hypothetical protein